MTDVAKRGGARDWAGRKAKDSGGELMKPHAMRWTDAGWAEVMLIGIDRVREMVAKEAASCASGSATSVNMTPNADSSTMTRTVPRPDARRGFQCRDLENKWSKTSGNSSMVTRCTPGKDRSFSNSTQRTFVATSNSPSARSRKMNPMCCQISRSAAL